MFRQLVQTENDAYVWSRLNQKSDHFYGFYFIKYIHFKHYFYIKSQQQTLLVPELFTAEIPSLDELPSFSLIVPACNEEHTVRDALLKLLEIDYPNDQIIVVNGRSTERTGELLDALQQEFPKLDIVYLLTLPAAWLGKVHVLHIGIQNASGNYLIHADADVHFTLILSTMWSPMRSIIG